MFLSKLARSFQTYANIYKKHVSQTESIENTSRRGISTTFSGKHPLQPYPQRLCCTYAAASLLNCQPRGAGGAVGAGGAGGPWQGFRHPRVDSKLAKCDLWSNMSHVSLMFVSLVRLRRDLRRPSQNMEIYQALKQHPIKQRKTI